MVVDATKVVMAVEEEEVVAPRLMLTNGSEQPPAPNAFDPTSVWEYRVKCEGVIIVAEVCARLAYSVHRFRP